MKRILIVDDSKTSRKFLKNMLIEAGFEVVAEAIDGIDGIEKYKEFSNKFEEDIFKAINLETCIMQRKVEGGPSPESVKTQIEYIKNKI